MKNISFDNPALLFLAIPLALLVILPHLFAIRKTNRTVATSVSLVIHLVIVCLCTLAFAGMKQTTVITKTEVYVVADISYSSDKHLDRVDEYIGDIEGKLPRNSEYGVICFGKDYVVNTPLGGSFTSVKDSGADNSATDIVSALEYAASLFSDDSIKRIVLITDGRQTAVDGRLTDDDGTMSLVQTIKSLRSRDIYVDAVYLDSNMSENETEVQLEGVDYIASTYLGQDATADILIRASRDMSATVTLSKDGQLLRTIPIDLTSGFNVCNIALPTDTVGQFRYDVHVEAQDDYSSYNNDYSFIQTIDSKMNLLVVAGSADDVRAVMTLFGDSATLDVYLVDGVSYNKYNNAEKNFGTTPNYENTTFHLNDPGVPNTVEALCVYDEYIFANLDVRTLNNYISFIDGIDLLVSEHGKSLLTIGDTYIQNKTDSILDNLQDMLPVQFGKNKNDPKAYTIVIDASLSMVGTSRQQIAKEAALRLTKLMNDGDRLNIVVFSGSIIGGVHTGLNPGDPTDVAEIENIINSIDSKQGTVIGVALREAYKNMVDLTGFSEKHVYLISDGLEGGTLKGDDSFTKAAQDMRKAGIGITTIGACCDEGPDGGANTMKKIASIGQGKFYNIILPENIDEIILTEIADDITQAVIEGQEVDVDIDLKYDSLVAGIGELPKIYGFVNATAKASANEVLSVDYISGRVDNGDGTYTENEAMSTLYAYWRYGEGRVACYTGALCGDWIRDWSASPEAMALLSRLCTTNIPEEHSSVPYSTVVNYDGISSTVYITPAVVKLGASVALVITMPDGTTVDATPVFNNTGYFHTFETPMLGQYNVHIAYTNDGKTYESDFPFCLPYSSEYDSFAYYYSTSLVKAVTPDGTVSTDGIPTLVNDESKVETYVLEFAAYLMAAAVALFLLDLVVRIMKWKDITAFFRRNTSTKKKRKEN